MLANNCPTATSSSRRSRAVLRPASVLLAFIVSLAGTSQPDLQLDRAARLDLLTSLPSSTHNSELRVDLPAGADLFRFWINSNEDDMRLYTPAGGQMDADFQVSAHTRAGQWPDIVELRLESRGYLMPGPGVASVILRADGRQVDLQQFAEAPARSGPLLFLAVRVEMSFDEWLGLVTADMVDGRTWDVPFRLLGAQLELLRAWTRRMGERQP